MARVTYSDRAIGEQLVDRARALGPAIQARAAETEGLRSLPAASVDDLIGAGFARALTPARFGGLQLGWDTAFEVSRLISSADASHGWCTGLLMEMAHFCGYLHPDAQEELWANGPDVPIASSVIPMAEIVPDGDGFRVTARSPFVSGINHAAWTLVAGFIRHPDGPDWCLALIPASDYEILDTWKTVGMCGTGSNTIVVNDVHVPATHILRMSEVREGDAAGSRFHDAHLYRLPWLSYGPLCFVTPMLGATQGAFSAFTEWCRSRVTSTGSAMADQPIVQVKLAEAAGNIDAAELLLRRAVDVTLDSELPTLELRARSIRDYGYSCRRLVAAIDSIMSMAGSSGFAETNVIQRTWRDVHFMSSHISMSDSGQIHWARMELGLGLQENQTQY